MKFTANRNELLEALTLTGKAIGHSLIPILSNYLLEISDEKIAITGGSQDVYVKNVISIQPSAINASIAVPKQRLFDLVKDLPNQPLNFEILGYETKAPQIKISTLSGNYIIPIESGLDYTRLLINEPTTFNLSSANLLNGFEKTVFSCSEDDLRPALTGVFLRFNRKDDTIIYVSTNTNVLSTVTIPISEKVMLQDGFIIPVKVLNILKDLPFDESVQVEVTGKAIQFTISPELVVQSILIDERYVDYETVIPVANELHLKINRLELLSSVKRVSKFSNSITTMVIFSISKGELKLLSHDLDLANQATEVLPIIYEDAPLNIGVSGKYLSQILTKLKTEEVNFSMSTPNRAIVIKEVTPDLTLNNKENLILLMPMFLPE